MSQIAPHCLHAGFVHQARQTPGNPALIVNGASYTYAALDAIARRWASRLLDVPGGRPCRVGVFASRNLTSYAGVLASLYAGAAFVPLNRKFPPERTRMMLQLADVDALIVDSELLPQLQSVLRGLPRMPVLLLPDAPRSALPHDFPARVFGREDLAHADALTELPETAPHSLAYLLFTSGSTGVPSGVPITHGNVRAFLDVCKARYRLTAEDRLTQTFDQTFDLSVFDLFMAWESGAAACSMQPVELLAPFEFLIRNNITVWFSVPSAAALLIKRNALKPGSMPTLRWSLFCGEGLPRATAEAWQKAAPQSVVENLYGPTELTIACSVYRWDPARSPEQCVNGLVPIGEIFPGHEAIIADEALRDAAPGAIGELCVAGPQTSPGYWGDARRTAARFFERTGHDGALRWFHRTGDLVMRREGGLVYIGRRDTQVKIGGHRVELGEIEGVLRQAGCTEAVAMVQADAQQPGHIVAVVSGAADLAPLYAAARSRLPVYMTPRAIHVIGEMPLNANGKVDRQALSRWLASGEMRAVG